MEVRMMNAVLAARALDWQSNAATQEQFQVPAEPKAIYEFASKAYTDEAVRSDLSGAVASFGNEHGLDLASVPTREVTPLTTEELDTLVDLRKRIEQAGVKGMIMANRSLYEESDTAPTLLVAALPVVVAVAVFVVLPVF
jgi:hypothetical protein